VGSGRLGLLVPCWGCVVWLLCSLLGSVVRWSWVEVGCRSDVLWVPAWRGVFRGSGVSLAGGSLACRHVGRLGFVTVRGAGVQQQLWSSKMKKKQQLWSFAAAEASVFSSSL
jgi:hypothetical protein